MAARRSSVILSRAEVRALALKAARGAGVPLGLAEEFSAASVALLAEGGPSKSLDLRHPETVATIHHTAEIVDALLCGAARTAVPAGTDPHLLAAGLRVAEAQYGGNFTLDPDSESILHVKTGSSCSLGEGPLKIEDDIYDILTAFAARTFVPESDTSRRRGAGSAAD